MNTEPLLVSYLSDQNKLRTGGLMAAWLLWFHVLVEVLGCHTADDVIFFVQVVVCGWSIYSNEMTDQGNNNQNISRNPFAALFGSIADAKQFALGQKQEHSKPPCEF